MKKRRPLNLALIREAEENLKRIAREHPELIDPDRANWTAEEVERLVTPIDPKDKALTLAEAAELLGCHVDTLRRAMKAGKLRGALIGRQTKFSKWDLQEYWTKQGGGILFPELFKEDGVPRE